MPLLRQHKIPKYLSETGTNKCPVCGATYRLEIFATKVTYYSHGDTDVCVYIKDAEVGHV